MCQAVSQPAIGSWAPLAARVGQHINVVSGGHCLFVPFELISRFENQIFRPVVLGPKNLENKMKITTPDAVLAFASPPLILFGTSFMAPSRMGPRPRSHRALASISMSSSCLFKFMPCQSAQWNPFSRSHRNRVVLQHRYLFCREAGLLAFSHTCMHLLGRHALARSNIQTEVRPRLVGRVPPNIDEYTSNITKHV